MSANACVHFSYLRGWFSIVYSRGDEENAVNFIRMGNNYAVKRVNDVEATFTLTFSAKKQR